MKFSLRQVSRTLRRVKGRKTVVLAGGTSDILHPGHLKYLAKCKELGDVLVVCVAGDARTRRRKGPNRPIVPAIQRAEVVANLGTVDFVFLSNSKPFSESVLRSIDPNVLVTSSNEPSRAAKHEFAAYIRRKHPEVKIVLTHRLYDTLSSSRLIRKITES